MPPPADSAVQGGGASAVADHSALYGVRPTSPLLTQPAVAAISGYLVFGEVLMPLDIFGMALLGSAFILARKSPTPSDALRNARVV